MGIIKDPLAGPWTAWKILCVIYLLLFSAYWLYNLIHVGAELKTAADIHQFTTTKLGLSERQLQTVSWPNIARRLVEVCSCPPSLAAACMEARSFSLGVVLSNHLPSLTIHLQLAFSLQHSHQAQAVHMLLPSIPQVGRITMSSLCCLQSGPWASSSSCLQCVTNLLCEQVERLRAPRDGGGLPLCMFRKYQLPSCDSSYSCTCTLSSCCHDHKGTEFLGSLCRCKIRRGYPWSGTSRSMMWSPASCARRTT